MRVQVKTPHVIAVVLAGAALSLCAAPYARAFGDERRVSYTFHFFSDVNGVQVRTHHGTAGAQLGRDATLSLQWAHDVVVIPAIEAPPGSQDAVDAITTASRPIAAGSDPFEDFVKVRDEIQGTVAYRNYKASYYVSTESDYFAQMVSLGYNRGFMGENLNVSAGLSYGWDDIQPLEDDDTEANPHFRKLLHANLVVTQILTPTTVVRVGGEFNSVRGLQHDPYRNVYMAGTNVPELHPAFRERRVGFARVSQYITNRSSVKVDYRYYDDDWGIESHTIGGKLSQYVTDQVVVRYRYRYYTQLPAFFYRDDYPQSGGAAGFRTGDYRLGDYGAHLFGGRVLWFPYGALGHVEFLRGAHLVFGYEHYFNSNNFSANVFETGLQITF